MGHAAQQKDQWLSHRHCRRNLGKYLELHPHCIVYETYLADKGLADGKKKKVKAEEKKDDSSDSSSEEDKDDGSSSDGSDSSSASGRQQQHE